MLLSRYFFKTVKEVPAEAELKSHQLLLRGGYIHRVSAGIYSYLPLAQRILNRIETILREEMNAIDGMEVNLPVTMPASLWSETGRYEAIGPEMLRFDDRSGRKMLLGMTHEEAVTDLARYVISSYKQLPCLLYQIQTKFRDEPRVRGGLIRVREFVMKDAYSFHASAEDLDRCYDAVYQAYFRIFRRCGLPVIAVASDVGMMGGTGAHEFMAVTESGEDTLVVCRKCDYKANREIATAARTCPEEPMAALEQVHTPGKRTIEEVSGFLGVKPERTLKAVAYSVNGGLVLCLIRGDLEINETKLKNHLRTGLLVMATDVELMSAGIVPGYASPVGLSNVRIIVDETVARSKNLVAGANRADYHVRNFCFGRDFAGGELADLASVREGDACPKCGAALRLVRGIEAGNIFKLGVKYSSSMKATFLDESGKARDLVMGCYGIGVGRLLASVIETMPYSNRVIWPISIAPFEAEVLGLFSDSEGSVRDVSGKLYQELLKAGVEVLFDDRQASPGVKFKDADLIGSPIRIAVGAKSLAKGGVELALGDQPPVIVAPESVVEEVLRARRKLREEVS